MPPLSWRIPTSGDPRLLRIGLAQIGLASIVAALLLFVAVPREWLVPGLLGLIPLAICMAYRRWLAYQRSMDGPDNVWIDDDGLNWIIAPGMASTLPLNDAIGFHIGRHSDTLRPVPALTLYLDGGFESQPFELHPPATPEAVRDWLQGRWNIPERNENDLAQASAAYDMAVSVYGECHEEFQEWHWEGTRDELTRFFAEFASVADDLVPPSLPGLKPRARIISLTRREPTRLRISYALLGYVEPTIIAAPGMILRKITSQAQEALSKLDSSPGDTQFDIALRPKNVWTFHLHVQPT